MPFHKKINKIQTTNVEFFNTKDLKKALEIYTRKELDIRGNKFKNIVFVNIDDIKNLQNSYPNYFLDTHKLLKILAKIVLGEF